MEAGLQRVHFATLRLFCHVCHERMLLP
jgi:hypothetical protein